MLNYKSGQNQQFPNVTLCVGMTANLEPHPRPVKLDSHEIFIFTQGPHGVLIPTRVGNSWTTVSFHSGMDICLC